jgi:hypothetical protein
MQCVLVKFSFWPGVNKNIFISHVKFLFNLFLPSTNKISYAFYFDDMIAFSAPTPTLKCTCTHAFM